MAVIRLMSRVGAAFAMSFALLFAVSAATPAGAATLSIGQLGGAPSACQANLEAIQTSVTAGTEYEVPAGNWFVTSWSTQAGE
jgi:hypothetical protein